MALSAPIAEAAVGLFGNSMLTQPRNLAVSWPWFALGLAAVLVAGPRRLAVAAVALVLAGFTIGAALMVTGEDFRRPDFKAAARFIDREAAPGDAVIDSAVAFITPGPVTGLDATLERAHRIIRAGAPQQRERNFSGNDPVLPTEEVVRRAAAGSGRPALRGAHRARVTAERAGLGRARRRRLPPRRDPHVPRRHGARRARLREALELLRDPRRLAPEHPHRERAQSPARSASGIHHVPVSDRHRPRRGRVDHPLARELEDRRQRVEREDVAQRPGGRMSIGYSTGVA